MEVKKKIEMRNQPKKKKRKARPRELKQAMQSLQASKLTKRNFGAFMEDANMMEVTQDLAQKNQCSRQESQM